MTGKAMRLAAAAAILFLSARGPVSGQAPMSGQADTTMLAERLERIVQARGSETPLLGADSGLSDYVAYALHASPNLGAARQGWQAALQKVEGATALPDPRVTYSYFAREVETRVGPQRHKAGVSQGLPWLGVRRLRGEMAAAQAAAQRLEYEQAKLQLYSDLVGAYAEYYYLGRALVVAREHVELMTHFEGVARRRYAVGAAPHSAAIQAQVELARLQDAARSLEDRRRPAAARINSLLSRPAGEVLPWPVTLDLPGGPARGAIDGEQAARWLSEGSPRLRQLEELAGKASAAASLAGKRGYPGITVGVEYVETGKPMVPGVPEAGKDPVMVMVSATVPLWRASYGAAAKAAQLERAAIRERRDDLDNRLQATLESGLYRVRDAERRMDLYRDSLVPLAEQSLEVARQAFESGQATFLTLVDAQRQLLELELGYERALADRLGALGELSALLNRDLVNGDLTSGPAPAPAPGELEE